MSSNQEIKTAISKFRDEALPGYTACGNSRYKVLRVYKRRLSNVYHVSLEQGFDKPKEVFVKVAKYAKDERGLAGKKLQQEYARHLDAYATMSPSAKFGIVRPLCVYPDVPAIITESFPDSEPLKFPIYRYLLLGGKKRREQTEKLLYATGEMLRAFHEPHLQDIENLSQVQTELGEYIKLRLKLIDGFLTQKNVIRQPSIISMFEDFMQKNVLGHHFGSKMLGLTHGDFTPGNVLYDGEKLALIDFSEAARAPINLDLASFINYLDMLLLNKPFFSNKRVKHLEMAFINGYGKLGEVEAKLCGLYQFRYLTTNLLTQLREMESSLIRGVVMRKRILRYLNEMEIVLGIS